MDLPFLSSMAVLTLLCVASFCAVPASGHGRLYEPPARGTMWRRGFDTPVNTQDHEMFCGGFTHQVSLGYKCGICGDPYDGERLNEAGGLYATGTIARTYHQGQEVLFQVELTANHKGYFEFRICPTNSPNIKATKECLDQNLLVMNNGDTRYYINFIGPAMVNVTVRLPADLTCDFCVVQWRYHTGNSWGTDPDGTSCLGCGYQEEFYGCADVCILADRDSTTAVTEQSTTGTVTTSRSGQSTTAYTTSSASTTTTTVRATPDDSSTCRSYTGDPDVDRWCTINCARSNCPRQICTCNDRVYTCIGIGDFSNDDAMSHWCLLNCVRGHCPAHLCSCSFLPV